MKPYSVESEVKCSVAERCIRPTREKLAKITTIYELEEKEFKWPEHIHVVDEYNFKDIHHFHNFTPLEAEKDENKDEIFQTFVSKFQWNMKYYRKPKFKVGDKVRLYR